MFTQVWKKYLPVIVILLKRSVNGDQVLKMNHTDFERAAGGKKAKYTFSNIVLNDGRTDIAPRHTPNARDFVQTLQESELTRQLIKKQQLEFTLNSDFELLIKNTTNRIVDTVDEQASES